MVIDDSNRDAHAGGFLGGFYVRVMDPAPLPGAPHRGHVHHIDHVGNLVAGQVRVRWIEGNESGFIDMLVPSKIHMPAGRHHEIEALSEGVIWECWFSQAEAERVHGSDLGGNYMLEA